MPTLDADTWQAVRLTAASLAAPHAAVQARHHVSRRSGLRACSSPSCAGSGERFCRGGHRGTG